MITRKISVTKAARHFADLVNRAYYKGESSLLIRSGQPVAMIVPVTETNILGKDWISAWQSMPHLDPDDADDFGECVENAREALDPARSPWD